MTDPFAGLPAPDAATAIGYVGGRLERLSEQRGPGVVGEAAADPAARWYLITGGRAVFNGDTALHDRTAVEAAGFEVATSILLGWQGGAPRLAVAGPADEHDEPPDHHVDLRTLAVEGRVDGATLGDLALARSLTHWHQRHRFCANCGATTRIAAGGYRRECPACGAFHFPRTDPVVIMLIIDTVRDEVLLGRSPRFAPGVVSCLAGFMEPGETIEDAVRRETLEESGIRVGRVRYVASQPWPFPSSLMIGCLAEGLSRDIHIDDDELEDCRWFGRADVTAMLAGEHAFRLPPPMAIAHHLIHGWVDG